MHIILALGILILGVLAYSSISTKLTEQQPYTVIKTIGDMEIRRYPMALTATVMKPGSTYKEVSNSGFRSLAGYIFGGNEGSKKIAMTAPVTMVMGSDSSRMSFVMPTGMTMDSLPRPNDPDIQLEKVPEEVVVAIRFGGFTNDEKIGSHAAELMAQAEAAGLEPIGPVRFLGYDPPWQLVARRNEVIVAVRWQE